MLASPTPEGQVPKISSEVSGLAAFLDQLPKVLEKFSAIEDQTKKVVTGVGEVTGKIKENPLLRLQNDWQYRDRLGQLGKTAWQLRWTEAAHLEKYFRLIEQIREEKRLVEPADDAADSLAPSPAPAFALGAIDE